MNEETDMDKTEKEEEDEFMITKMNGKLNNLKDELENHINESFKYKNNMIE